MNQRPQHPGGSLSGVLVVDKPAGRTSFAVVREIRRLLRVRKVGHAGTLDPMATGVLPICLGEGTKVATFLLHSDKCYVAEITFGIATDTEDAEGEVIERCPVPDAARDPLGLAQAVAGFVGPGRQMPPVYSALKVDGQRAHRRARAGEQVTLKERDVTVHEAHLEEHGGDVARVSLRVSKGFYVRSFARDLGRALGTCAHLSALRRTRSGPFSEAQAITLEEIERLRHADEALPLIGCSAALAELPLVEIDEATAASVRNGHRPLHGEVSVAGHPVSGWIRLVDPGGALAAVVRRDPQGADDTPLKMERVFRGAG